MAKKILLADDSITIQKVVELVLAEEDFEIKSVNNGEDALNVISSFKPDIALVDIVMPKVNGYQLCEKIKSNPETSDIPVLLLAGAFEPLDEELAKNVGADDHIIKPFESQELISKINSALTSRAILEGAGAVAEEEAEEAVEALVSSEEGGEDIWAMEDIVSEAIGTEAIIEEETPVEEAFGAEEVAVSGEATIFEEELPPAEVPVEEKPVLRETVRAEVTVPTIEVPSKEDIAAMITKAVDDKVSAAISIDLSGVKESLISSLSEQLKESADKVLWEVVPQVAEKLIKEMLEGAFASITKEVEKVIWETVPDLAERIISTEIEKIKSEI